MTFTVDWGSRPCRVCQGDVNYFGATCDACWKCYCVDTCGVTYTKMEKWSLQVFRLCLDCMYGREYE